MKIFKPLFTLLLTLSVTTIAQAQSSYSIVSPDGRLAAAIELKDKIYYSLSFNDEALIAASPISMELYDGTVWGAYPKARKKNSTSVNEMLTPLYGKRKQIKDHFNELTITFRGNYTLTARMYDEGFAYRFGYTRKEKSLLRMKRLPSILPRIIRYGPPLPMDLSTAMKISITPEKSRRFLTRWHTCRSSCRRIMV
jgi:alpha-glucosidase